MGIKKKVVQPKPVQQTTAMVVVDDRVYTKPRHDAGKLKVTRKDNTIDLFTSNEPNANAIVPIPVGENPEQTNVLTHADIYRSIAKIGEAMANVGKKSKVEYDKLRKLGAKPKPQVKVPMKISIGMRKKQKRLKAQGKLFGKSKS